MKRSMLTGVLLLLAATCPAQELKKGNLVGTHLLSVKLQPGVTQEQYARAYSEKVAPAIAKMTGWRVYPVKRIRGEKADGLAVIMVIASEAERDKYFSADGTPNDAGKAVLATMQSAQDELSRLGTITADTYTDWLVE